jgi:hypothetical protein
MCFSDERGCDGTHELSGAVKETFSVPVNLNIEKTVLHRVLYV